MNQGDARGYHAARVPFFQKRNADFMYKRFQLSIMDENQSIKNDLFLSVVYDTIFLEWSTPLTLYFEPGGIESMKNRRQTEQLAEGIIDKCFFHDTGGKESETESHGR